MTIAVNCGRKAIKNVTSLSSFCLVSVPFTSKMAASRTIEEYVADIVYDIDASNYDDLADVYDTLQRMRMSVKQKHELNYWRVIQCLVEVAIDKMVMKLIRIDTVSCKCHLSSNMYCLMRFFVDSITTVNVVKRVLYFKDSFGPVCFKMIRQTNEEPLAMLGYDAIHRCLCVGKMELAEWYMQYGIMKDLYQYMKKKFDTNNFTLSAVVGVSRCGGILVLLAECGTENTRKQIRFSSALKVLAEYVVKFKKQKGMKERLRPAVENILHLRNIVTDEKKALEAFSNWKAKDKLQDSLEEEVLLFCSSPSCRKMQDDFEKFRYCGACKLARYCSERCQRDHWKLGHKTLCLRLPMHKDE